MARIIGVFASTLTGRFGARLGLLLPATGLALPLIAATVSQTLLVQIAPEATLSRRGESTVVVKVRLAPGAQAALWIADSCGAAIAAQHYTIAQSGVYAIPVALIPGVQGGDICLAASDGSLMLSLP